MRMLTFQATGGAPETIPIEMARSMVGGKTDDETEGLFYRGYPHLAKVATSDDGDAPPPAEELPSPASEAIRDTFVAGPDDGKKKRK